MVLGKFPHISITKLSKHLPPILARSLVIFYRDIRIFFSIFHFLFCLFLCCFASGAKLPFASVFNDVFSIEIVSN